MIPGISQLTAKDLKYRLQAARAKSIITSDVLAPQVDAISADCPSLQTKLLVSDTSRPGWINFRERLREASTEHNCVRTKSGDSVAIYFTSGTTGAPKMVEHSQCSYGLGFVASGRRWMALTESDIFWNTTDTGWVKAAWTLFSAWSNGACIFVHELSRVDAKTILDVLSSYPISSMVGAPLIYRMLLQQDLSSYKFPHLHSCFTGGESLLSETLENWKAKTGLDIREFYGQTETGITCRVSRTMKVKPGSLGTAIPHYDVQIIDDLGNVLPPGKEGDIAIRVKPNRPIGIFSGYVNNPKKTEANIRGDFWLLGDRGIKDPEGYFYFIARTDDIINSSGYRIGPSEVENALMEHPAVAETAVTSSPDPSRGEVVKAFVVLAPEFLSHDPDQLTKLLQQHVKSVTAPYKYPRKVEFVLNLPKTITGKINRAKLRNEEWKTPRQGQNQ
ncbi:Acyl-coenzyme A synthetase ACSM5, mitochondrial [Lemmus lemmus]